jgi:mono/diheme cytochrome c family protein
VHASAHTMLRAAVCLLLTAGSTAAQQPAPAPPDTTAITPAMVDAGRVIFHSKGMCFACHGAKLEGTQVAPTLIKTVWKDAKGGDIKAIHYVATHGVPGTVMVPYPGGITPAEAANVVSYIWSVNNRKVKP